MRRDILEKITSSLVVTLITLLVTGTIVMAANLIFQWDIFPPSIEKFLYFLALAVFIIIIGATLINLMLNISRLAFFAQQIAQKLLDDHAKRG